MMKPIEIDLFTSLDIIDEVKRIFEENLSNYNGEVCKPSSFKADVLTEIGARIHVLYVANHFLAIWCDKPMFIAFAFTENKRDKYGNTTSTYANRILFTSKANDIDGNLTCLTLEDMLHIGGVTSFERFEETPFYKANTLINEHMYYLLCDKYLGINKKIPKGVLDFIKK